VTIIGELLLGQYKNDLMNGKGTYYYAGGNKYIGDWIDGYKTGHGVFIWSDGSQYQGSCPEKIGHHFL
jgi:hypothetical protein